MWHSKTYLALHVLCTSLISGGPQNINFVLLIQPQQHIKQFINDSYREHHNQTLDGLEVDSIFGFLAATSFFSGFFMIAILSKLVNILGRKFIIFGLRGACNLLASVCGLAGYYTNHFELLFASRAFYGLDYACGVVVMGIYLAEIAPPLYRGRLVQAQLFGNWSTILLVYVIGIPEILGSADRWFYMFYLPVPLVIIQFIVYFFIFESPKHLYLNRHDEVAAREVVGKLYNGLEESVDQIMEKFDNEAKQSNKTVSFMHIIKTPHLRHSFILASCLFLAQTTSGSYIFNQYAKGLYETELHVSASSASYVQVVTGFLIACCAFIAYHLTDRLGRRPLVIGGLGAVTLIGVALVIVKQAGGDNTGSSWTQIVLTTMIICILPLCLSAPCNNMAHELTPHAAKPIVGSAGTFLGTAANVAYFFLFPLLNQVIGVYAVLVLIVGPCLLIGSYFYFELPETRLRSVDDVVAEIMRKKYGHAVNQAVEKRDEETNGADELV